MTFRTNCLGSAQHLFERFLEAPQKRHTYLSLVTVTKNIRRMTEIRKRRLSAKLVQQLLLQLRLK